MRDLNQIGAAINRNARRAAAALPRFNRADLVSYFAAKIRRYGIEATNANCNVILEGIVPGSLADRAARRYIPEDDRRWTLFVRAVAREVARLNASDLSERAAAHRIAVRASEVNGYTTGAPVAVGGAALPRPE